MYLKIILHLILIVFFSLLHLSFIQNLPSSIQHFNLVLVILIFVLALSGLPKALVWGVGAGFVFDVYNFFPFGLFMICLVITVIAAHFLLTNFFTDRSLFSYLALIFTVTFLYNILFYSGVYVLNLYSEKISFFLTVEKFWSQLGWEIFWNWAAGVILFYFFNFVSDRLSAVFLKR